MEAAEPEETEPVSENFRVAATGSTSASPAAPLSILCTSLSLTASAWSAIKRTGACACCAARLVGCRDAAAYACDDRSLREQLDARFFGAAKDGNGDGDCCDGDGGGERDVDDDGRPLSLKTREECCPLCLGLLQSEIPLRIAPRPRPSSLVHGDHNRACCQQTRPPTQEQQQRSQSPTRQGGNDNKPNLTAAASATGAAVGAGKLLAPTNANPAESAAGALTPTATTPIEGVDNGTTTTCSGGSGTNHAGYNRARMVEAIADCVATRGYTVSSFGITAAVPACLALRDAAFLEAGYGLSSVVAPTSTPSPSTTTKMAATEGQELPPTTQPAAVVSVKEALKMGLARALKARLHIEDEGKAAEGDGTAAPAETSPPAATNDLDSDFLVEVTAKAPEADAHAMTALLGGPPPSRSTQAKQHGWSKGGRWAKKRQRREEQRNPGLTVGAVKKALANLDDEGRKRMKRWVLGLLEKGKGGEGGEGKKAVGIVEAATRRQGKATLEGHQNAACNADAGKGVKTEPSEDPSEPSDNAHEKTVDRAPAADCTETAGISDVLNVSSNGCGTVLETSSSLTVSGGQTLSDAHNDTREVATNARTTSTDGSSVEACCDVAIRRHSIHFWGRYTKHSRSVPQTPWMRGFYSVQEAVAEPFEKFSGCVEGLLHGAGREDVDVRMLGDGRPFCLELVDSLRSVDEVAAQLPSLAAAINSATGIKNAGGGVTVSRLRVAGPGELPSDVQAVGEGKRKHYRCVVWVSRAIGSEEVVKVLCDTPPPEGLVVQQATPIRVLHRRTLLDRPRSIFDMRVEWINEHFFQLDLTTSAGTYIKEFVHGDLGRTVPSIGSLLNCRADILQLDVTNVEDKWSAKDNEEEEEEVEMRCNTGAVGVASLTTAGSVEDGGSAS